MDALPSAIHESAFDQSPIGEYLLSPSDDPIILAVNDAFLRASGRTRESLVGQRLFEAFPGNPDDKGDTGEAALRRSLASTIATRTPQQLPLQRYPIRVTLADGREAFEERFWHAVNTPIFDESKALLCIAHRTEDVTEQTRVAAALQRSSERLSFQLALSDRLRPLTCAEEIAAAASSMLGKQLGVSRVTYVEVDDLEQTFVQRQWQSGVAHHVSERRQLEDFGPEIIAILRRGDPLVIEDVQSDPRSRAHASAYASIEVRSNLAVPLVKAGKLSIVLSLQHIHPREWSQAEIDLAVDVAERTWSAAENARAQEELRIANRRKDEFLAMLAHELRNPLAPIRLAAEILERGAADGERVKRSSEIIARQVRHLSGLVDDLLDVSRVTRGMVTLNETPQDMKSVLASAAEQVRPMMESLRHHLTLELPPVAAIVCGDGKRLVQVLGNLLSNAAKFTPPEGHVNVTMTVDDGRVLIRIQDDGVGIPLDQQPHVFELFMQVARSADRSQGGLGLGLALVKTLVERHHGSVSLFSAGEGKGTCFTVCLPLIESDRQVLADPGPPRQRRSTRSIDVLIVDDNKDAAEMLKAFLEDAGHRTRIAHDPIKALELARLRPFEVGVIDIGLPFMTGYELVRRLRKADATQSSRYVALTGYGQPSDRQLALEAGFDEHLVKPVDPSTLLVLLDALIVQQGGPKDMPSEVSPEPRANENDGARLSRSARR